MPTSPIEVVGQWLQNLIDPDDVSCLVAPDATYVSLNTENAELAKIMPRAGTSHGPQAFLDNLGKMFTRWDNRAFNVTTMFASDKNVAVFGDFLQVALAGQSRELAVLDPGEGPRREGDLPAVPRGQLRHRRQLPQGRLLDRPDRSRRPTVPGSALTTNLIVSVVKGARPVGSPAATQPGSAVLNPEAPARTPGLLAGRRRSLQREIGDRTPTSAGAWA
jgi:hypothetical protein